MKILMLGDLHLGVRKDDPKQMAIIEDAINQAIEYSKANNINTWIQTGDWFDVRAAITHTTMEFNSKVIIPKLREAGIRCHVIVGNHDMKFKNTITPNACTELLTQFDDVITVHENPSTVQFGNTAIDMIPWMCEGNIKEILGFIKSSSSQRCVGHWELDGFYYYKNMKSEGYSANFLSGYEKVYSGHYHTISQSGNVLYIGTPYTITSGDENDPRGFWVIDTDDQSKDEFIENATMWHQRIDYPECTKDPELFDKVKDCYVRLVINEQDDNLREFETKLESVAFNVRSILSDKILTIKDEATINDDAAEFDLVESVDLVNSGDGHLVSIMNNYIDVLSIDDSEKNALKDMINNLHTLCKDSK